MGSDKVGALSADEQALRDIIKRAIVEHGGKITFAQYMALALYAPCFGYYRNTLPKFGKEGDFITAPEVSPLFGACLAVACARTMAAMYSAGSKAITLIEFGAGSGKLAVHMLQALDDRGSLPEQYYIVELSAVLQARQMYYIQQQLPHHLFERVKWLTTLPNERLDAIVIANEVLDAMPVHRFQQSDKLEEVYVTRNDRCQAGGFSWFAAAPSSSRLVAHVEQLGIVFPDGYCSEVNLNINGWLASLSDFLNRGLVLLIDYGFLRQEYYHPQRSSGTVMCHYRHHSHSDPFIHIGCQDITAHVDFSHVRDAALANGFEIMSYSTQADFLIDCSLLEVAQAQFTDEDVVAQYEIGQQIKQLTLPSEMGELFKVMALARNINLEIRFN